MIRHSILSAACAVLLFSGCVLFHKRDASKHKESPYIATQVEQEFEQRWVDKRTAELAAQGVNAAAAREQAVGEFRQKFSATKAAQEAR